MLRIKKCFDESTGAAQGKIFQLGAFKKTGLDLSELGILATLFSLPDGWEFSVEEFAKMSSDDIVSTAAVIRRLEEKKYLIFDKKTLYIYSEPKTKGDKDNGKTNQ